MRQADSFDFAQGQAFADAQHDASACALLISGIRHSETKHPTRRRAMVRHLVLAKGNRGVVILMMVLAIIASSRLPLQAQNTTVAGVIQNASGQPVAGALVKVRSAELGLTFLVVSQAQGRYSTPNLLPGKYTV